MHAGRFLHVDISQDVYHRTNKYLVETNVTLNFTIKGFNRKLNNLANDIKLKRSPGSESMRFPN